MEQPVRASPVSARTVASGTVFPVVYMIHGIGMSAESMVVSVEFSEMWMRAGKMQKFIMVFPDGECQEDKKRGCLRCACDGQWFETQPYKQGENLKQDPDNPQP